MPFYSTTPYAEMQEGDAMERKNEAKWIESRSRWQINVQNDGERKTFTSSVPGRKGKIAAEKKADAWLNDPTSSESVRVSALLDQYEKYLTNAKSTTHARQYKGFIRLYIRDIIGHKRINRLTEGDLQDIIDTAYAQKKLSDKTLRDIRACIMSFLKWCRSHGKTRMYPESLIIPAGAKKSAKQVIQPDGISKLFSSTTTIRRGSEIEDFYIHAYRFAVLTGLRPGELRGLENRVDVRGNRVTVRRAINVHDEITQGKNNNARRTFQLTPLAQQEVKAQRDMLKRRRIISPYLFPAPDGGQMKHDHFYRCWKRYCEANGIPPVSLYELRHTYVSVNKEMPEGLKKMVVGHSKDMDTEGVYGHEMAGDMEKAAAYTAQAFDAIIGKKATE